jgi:hypothetical protein
MILPDLYQMPVIFNVGRVLENCAQLSSFTSVNPPEPLTHAFAAFLSIHDFM